MPLPYVKQIWQDDNVSFPVSATRLGVLETGVFDAHYRPSVTALLNATLTLSASTWTPVTFGSERYDTDNMHSTTVNTNRLTAVTPGYYLASGGMFYSAGTADVAQFARIVQIVSGVTTIVAAQGGQKNSTGSIAIDVSAGVQLAAGDYLAMDAFSSATTFLITGNPFGAASLSAHLTSY